VKLKLALVGCGAMGSALLRGWLSLTYFDTVWVIAPHRNKVEPFLGDPRVHWLVSPDQLPETPDLILFAVKPSLLEEILPLYRSFNSLIISVAAGKAVSFYERHFLTHPIIRAMPNIPVCIHQGVIGLLANTQVTPDRKVMVGRFFQDLGLSIWLSSDEEVDKLTALSGSGPAYVYYMMESFANAAENLGFDTKTAYSLALQTFLGATLYAQEVKQPPALLRQHVTSLKGTTEAALQVLEKGGLKDLMDAAIKAAFERAKELRE
jgi:pyrroline-5-carboxylate reductase